MCVLAAIKDDMTTSVTEAILVAIKGDMRNVVKETVRSTLREMAREPIREGPSNNDLWQKRVHDSSEDPFDLQVARAILRKRPRLSAEAEKGKTGSADSAEVYDELYDYSADISAWRRTHHRDSV